MPVWEQRHRGQLWPFTGGIFVSISSCGTSVLSSPQVARFLLLSALTPVVSYSVPGFFKALWSHSRRRAGKKCLYQHGVPWKCGITCWLLSDTPSSDVAAVFLVLSGAKWLQQVEELKVSGLGTWRQGLQELRRLCRGTWMLLPKHGVVSEFPVAAKEEVSFVRKASPVVLMKQTNLSTRSVCVSHLQTDGSWLRAGSRCLSKVPGVGKPRAARSRAVSWRVPMRRNPSRWHTESGCPRWKALCFWSSVWALGFANPHFVKWYKL